MPLVSYKNGISSLGYDEHSDDYICDWPDCKELGEFDGYCELHFELCGAAAEAERDAAAERGEY